MKNDKFSSTLVFIDFLFILTMGFAALFYISFILIRPEAKQNEDFKRKAEFIITMEWPPDNTHDIDLWVKDPNGDTVSFRSRENNFMKLDTDDLGNRNDFAIIGGKRIEVKLNREVVTIRGIIPGEYIVNVHYYSNHGGKSKEFPVDVEVIKVNPSFFIVYKGTKQLSLKGQELTFIRFVIDKKGKLLSTNDLQTTFINSPFQN